MFLAPAGNPSSLRVGHPDVATEHTGLSPAYPPSPDRGRSGGGSSEGTNCGLLGLGRVCAEAGKEYSGWVPQTAYRGRQIGIWVPRWFRRDVEAPTRRLAAKGLIATMRARTDQLYLPDATSGCPSSARAGAPVGAKEVYSVPSAYQSVPSTPASSPAGAKEVYSAPSTRLKTLEECSAHYTAVLT